MLAYAYLFSFLIPFCCFISLYIGGSFYSAAAIVMAFIITPLLDTLPLKLASAPRERGKYEVLALKALLLSNVPIVYGLIIYAAIQWSQFSAAWYEWLMQLMGLGVVLGSNGINVAHELGHRHTKLEQRAAWALLLPSFYMHFFVEHNYGHHKHVATPQDPASARKNETVYAFIIRSVLGSFISALRIQQKQLTKANKPWWSAKNKMLYFLLAESTYIALLFSLLAPSVALALILSGVVGFIMLELVNYVEHYGLVRKKTEKQRYERVRAWHSWNADYAIGRLVLFELTLHSDHHFLARKPYYELESLEDAPMLPFGYPAAMLVSLLPPLWFSIMNKRIPKPRATTSPVPTSGLS